MASKTLYDHLKESLNVNPTSKRLDKKEELFPFLPPSALIKKYEKMLDSCLKQNNLRGAIFVREQFQRQLEYEHRMQELQCASFRKRYEKSLRKVRNW